VVYDVSSFIDEHPGGKKILQRVLGQDASKQFWKYHNEKVMQKYGAPLKIGTIGSSSAQSTSPAHETKPAQPKYNPPKPKLPTQAASAVKASSPSDGKSASEIFGEVKLIWHFLILAHSVR
jgi:cytochrome b involved in lipid metabolism